MPFFRIFITKRSPTAFFQSVKLIHPHSRTMQKIERQNFAYFKFMHYIRINMARQRFIYVTEIKIQPKKK